MMAEFVSGLNMIELLKFQLKCPFCFITMKPPIYQCSSGHPFCEKCWEKEEKCLRCNEIFRDTVKPDTYDGYKLYDYRCKGYRNCRSIILDEFQRQWYQFHSVKGDGKPYEFTCGRSDCRRESGKLYPLKGVLVTEEELEAAKRAFKPMRSTHLEMYTAFVLYPCENKGCIEKVVLAGKVLHDAQCAHRPVGCPIKDCTWKGSIQLVPNHILESNEHTAVKIKQGSPIEHSFNVPPVTTGKQVINNVVLYEGEGTLASALVLSIAFPRKEDKPVQPVQLSLARIVGEVAGKNVACKVRFRSSNLDGDALMYSFVAQSNMGKKWINIPSLPFLEENGYVSKDDKSQKIKVEIIIKDKKEEVQISSDEKPAVLSSVD